ncbi:MAG: glycoside hydrolase, family [Segetibacter sp.]|nr:glycoside hydrolase, family [Segetibacter sp.]
MLKKTLPLILALIYLFVLPGCKRKTDEALPKKTHKDDARSEIIEALEFEFEMTKDPATGKIPEGIRGLEAAEVLSISNENQRMNRISDNNYSFQGPDNLGGRTRSVVYDVRYDGNINKTVMAAGVSGGVWKSLDGGVTWVRKSPPNVHYSCTSIAQDTRTGQQDTWYYSTGEALGNSANAAGAGYFGNGIYKSSDNGETWTRLASSNTTALETFTTAMDAIMKIQVNPIDGAIYAAALATIRRSTDGGATWETALGGTLNNSSQVTDVVITSTGRLYAAFAGSNTNTVDGIWTSETGAPGTWTKLAGTGAATNPSTWDAQSTYGRVVLAITPSNENLIYAMYSKGTSSCINTPTPEARFFKWDLLSSTWTNLSANLPDEPGCSDGNDPFAVQGGYDMVVAVHPTNPNLILIGGTNAYRSTDGFTSAINTKRIGGYAGPSTYTQYTNSHPDIHTFAFVPNTNALLCGNDGGVQRTEDVTAEIVSWVMSSNGFRTYQYYYVALDPRAGNNKVIGGAQDNGTTRNIGGSGVIFENVLSGDGVSVGLSKPINGATFEYAGSQSGSITRRNSTSLPFYGTNIRPILSNANGLFITLFHLDPDTTEFLYYVNKDTVYRTTSASTVNRNSWTNLTGVSDLVAGSITALTTTRGAYTPNSSLFFGTNGSKLYRLNDPANVDPITAPVDISSSSFNSDAYISSIAVNPRNDDTAIVTFSNYGVVSVWWTGNAKSATPTWQNIEGNLTLPSYRSSAIAIVNGEAEYYVGTSSGLFRTKIDGTNPTSTVWVQEASNEIGNAVVRDLKLRTIDNNLLVGTHGFGMWRVILESSTLPVNISRFNGIGDRNYNLLNWTVEGEINSRGYSIERKYKNQLLFTSVGYVAARGDGNNTAATYNFKDVVTDFSVDQTLYRLKQEDKDGKSKYSSVVTINRKPSVKLVQLIAANKSTLIIKINGNASEKFTVRITDMNGRQLARQEVIAGTQQIPIAYLPSGIYLTEILMGSERMYIQRFVK